MCVCVCVCCVCVCVCVCEREREYSISKCVGKVISHNLLYRGESKLAQTIGQCFSFAQQQQNKESFLPKHTRNTKDL